MRYFAEYPSLQDGLSLTQRLSLESLADGAGSAGAIFRDLMLVRDPQPYAGDQMYWPELGELCTGPHAAITGDYRQPKATLELTMLGHQLLRGEADLFTLRNQEKCFGGVCIDPTRSGFRWDRENSTLTQIE